MKGNLAYDFCRARVVVCKGGCDMFHSPEQPDIRWSRPKTETEMSDDEVRQVFDALIAKLNEEERSASGKR